MLSCLPAIPANQQMPVIREDSRVVCPLLLSTAIPRITVNPKRNQPWMFTGRTDAEAEPQYFGHRMRKADSLEKTLMLGKIEAGGEENDRGPDGWMESLIQWT